MSDSTLLGATSQTIEATIEALQAGEVLDRTAVYIDGQWVPSDGAGRIEVRTPRPSR